MCTKHKRNLYVQNISLSKGVGWAGIKLFSNHMPTTRSLNFEIKVFKRILKQYLYLAAMVHKILHMFKILHY